jgi:hypothetical protein
MTPDEEIAKIKRDTFETFKGSRRVWIIEERVAEFIVHTWSGEDAPYGAGVGPGSGYPTLRKAAARLLQLLHVGPVAPQTWPESVCIGNINFEPTDGPPETNGDQRP